MGIGIPMSQKELVDYLCEVMHDAYERAALGTGWETNPESRKPWEDVPEANKDTMRHAVKALLDEQRNMLYARQPVGRDHAEITLRNWFGLSVRTTRLRELDILKKTLRTRHVHLMKLESDWTRMMGE